jgi:hypothetical protein
MTGSKCLGALSSLGSQRPAGHRQRVAAARSRKLACCVIAASHDDISASARMATTRPAVCR